MTGAFLRIKRDGAWQNIEVERMTKYERRDHFLKLPPEEAMKWMDMLCEEILSLEVDLGTLDDY